MDEADLDTLRSIVTDDILITRGDNPTEQGMENFLDVYRAHNALQVPVCKHVVTNVLAEPDGDEIRTHAYFQATFLEEARTRVIIGVLRRRARRARREAQAGPQEDPRRSAVLELPASTGVYAHVGKEQ